MQSKKGICVVPTNEPEPGRNSLRNIVLLCLLLFLVSACVPIRSNDSRLDLRAKEEWELQLIIMTPPDSGTYAGLMTEALNETVAELHADEISARWQSEGVDQEGNQVYVVNLKGQSYDKLNEGVFSDEVITILKYVERKTNSLSD
jgi:hypothetical protein